MIVLGIETSCDETAAAVLDGGRVLSNVVASQDDVHAPYGGVVPELASRRHVEVLVPVVAQGAGPRASAWATSTASRSPTDRAWSARCWSAARRPRRWPGARAAAGRRQPPRGPHLRRVPDRATRPSIRSWRWWSRAATPRSTMPRAATATELIGQTRDDAAGEAFDKVAKLLGLGYPGRARVERIARRRSRGPSSSRLASMTDGAPDFSFSGIKTAVSLHVRRNGPLGPSRWPTWPRPSRPRW